MDESPPGAARTMTVHQTRMSKKGHVLIPAAVRRELGFGENELLSIYVQDGEVRIVSRIQAVRHMQRRMAKYRKSGESVVDELLRERRGGAERK